MLENKYKQKLVKKLRVMFPDCHIQHNDARESPGIPDLTIFVGDRWGMLEVKKSAKETCRPNQEYWVEHYNTMSFAAFIYPENEEQVLNELQRSLGSTR